MSDRLEAIKKWLKGNYVLKAEWSAWNNIKWLISELEKCRKDIADRKGLTSIEQDAGMGWKDKAEKAEARLQQHDDYHCGGSMLYERSEEVKTENKKLKAEVKRLKAMLAIGHFVIRE